MKVHAYIHSLKDRENDRNVIGEAEILECIMLTIYTASAGKTGLGSIDFYRSRRNWSSISSMPGLLFSHNRIYYK